jgi:hypothetical protein
MKVMYFLRQIYRRQRVCEYMKTEKEKEQQKRRSTHKMTTLKISSSIKAFAKARNNTRGENC